MVREKQEYYIYVVNGKEFFTSNIDFAFKRCDEGVDIKVIYGQN